MAVDPNRMTPSGKTSAQIDAEQAEYVQAANAALASARNKGACWSSYWASHSTFEMLVGEPCAKDNLILSMSACDYLTGPVQWPTQQIEIVFHCSRASASRAWEFEIRDQTVGFRAVGATFRWRRGHDLWAQGGLWFGRGAGPATPLSCDQATEELVRMVRHFYQGTVGYSDLSAEVTRILDQLPVIPGRANASGG